MNVQELPRVAVRLSLQAARLPLTAAEVLLDHHELDWAPALAFDGAQSRIKEVAGGVLRDPVLAEEGRLLAAKVTKLRQAGELEALAEDRRAEAADELGAARERADRKRRAAAASAARRKRQAAQSKAAADRKIAARAAEHKAQAEKATAAATAATKRNERRQRTAVLAKEQAALEKEKAAMARRAKADATDAKIASSKRRRAAS